MARDFWVDKVPGQDVPFRKPRAIRVAAAVMAVMADPARSALPEARIMDPWGSHLILAVVAALVRAVRPTIWVVQVGVPFASPLLAPSLLTVAYARAETTVFV